MAYSQLVRKQLEGVELIDQYEAKETVWRNMAIKADRAAEDACEEEPEPDDVAAYLAIALEPHQDFIDCVDDSRATSVHKWARPFADYVVKFQWESILKARKERQND